MVLKIKNARVRLVFFFLLCQSLTGATEVRSLIHSSLMSRVRSLIHSSLMSKIFIVWRLKHCPPHRKRVFPTHRRIIYGECSVFGAAVIDRWNSLNHQSRHPAAVKKVHRCGKRKFDTVEKKYFNILHRIFRLGIIFVTVRKFIRDWTCTQQEVRASALVVSVICCLGRGNSTAGVSSCMFRILFFLCITATWPHTLSVCLPLLLRYKKVRSPPPPQF